MLPPSSLIPHLSSIIRNSNREAREVREAREEGDEAVGW
jgi:hypothetical protein